MAVIGLAVQWVYLYQLHHKHVSNVLCHNMAVAAMASALL